MGRPWVRGARRPLSGQNKGLSIWRRANTRSQERAYLNEERSHPVCLEQSKKHRRVQTGKRGSLLSVEPNLDFILCVVRSYWNILSRDVICIFKRSLRLLCRNWIVRKQKIHSRDQLQNWIPLSHTQVHTSRDEAPSSCFHLYLF